MDRLPALIISAAAVAALVACEERRGEPAGRADSVKASKPSARAADGFCDLRFSAAEAPRFELPAVTGAVPAAAEGWQWINVWATWCKPCLEELPLLQRWQTRLTEAGRPVSFVFVSADASDDLVAAFRADHPSAPTGPRLADPDAMMAWVTGLGLGEASLPLQILVDPAARVRCVRAGAVHERDFAAVEQLLR